MSHGKHRALPRRQRISHIAVTTGAIATVAGLSLGVAVPAQAATVAQDAAPGSSSSAPVSSGQQTLTVSPAVVDTTVTRDQPSATSQATLDAQAAAARAAQAATRAVSSIPAAGTSGNAIVAYAEQYVGVVPYVDSPSAVSPSTGFECDSFVDWVFAHTTGRILPRGVNEIAALGTVIPASAAGPGDLVVYPGQHIGIYAGGGMMVDAPKPGEYVSLQTVWGNPEYVRL